MDAFHLHKLFLRWFRLYSARIGMKPANRMFRSRKMLPSIGRTIRTNDGSYHKRNSYCSNGPRVQHKQLQWSELIGKIILILWFGEMWANLPKSIVVTNWANFNNPGKVFKYPVFKINADVELLDVVVRVIVTECDILFHFVFFFSGLFLLSVDAKIVKIKH